MEIVDQYQKIANAMEETETQIALLEHEIVKLEHEYCPREVKGLSYDLIVSRSKRTLLSLEEIRIAIESKTRQISKYKDSYSKLKKRKESLEIKITSYGGVKSEIIMMRCKGYSNKHIARKLGYSIRQINRY